MKKLLIFLLLQISIFVHILQAENLLPEYTMKAAYLYNFALLTDWPEDEENDFTICFYTEDFGEASDALNDKILHNKRTKIKTVTLLEEAKSCQIVFIREGEEHKGVEIVQKLLRLPILVVSESGNLLDSHIRILRENRKLAFDISLNSLKGSDLKVSSRLLKLARNVQQ